MELLPNEAGVGLIRKPDYRREEPEIISVISTVCEYKTSSPQQGTSKSGHVLREFGTVARQAPCSWRFTCLFIGRTLERLTEKSHDCVESEKVSDRICHIFMI